jgi:hypothetical protein
LDKKIVSPAIAGNTIPHNAAIINMVLRIGIFSTPKSSLKISP